MAITSDRARLGLDVNASIRIHPVYPVYCARTQRCDREEEDDELSLGRRGDRPLAGRARGLHIYDRQAPALLRFLGRRAGARVAAGLVGELFRFAFERRKTFALAATAATRRSTVMATAGASTSCWTRHRAGVTYRVT
jgi:hypothetical protein